MQAFVYLLHFDEPLSGRAGHYSGATMNLRARLTRHANGGGSALMRELFRVGIGWRLGNLWTCCQSNRYEAEMMLKKQHNLERYCTLCRGGSQYATAGAREYAIENLPFSATSEALRTHGSREVADIRFTGPDEPKSTAQQIDELMTKDKIALGYIPIGGEAGLNVLIPRGQIVLAQVEQKVVGYAAFTMRATDDGIKRVLIQQCVVSDEERLGGTGRRLIQAIERETRSPVLGCNVRADLPANGFWAAIGFREMHSFRHKTSNRMIITWRKELQHDGV